MSNWFLATIVFAELVAGLYLRWTLPGLWGPWALVAALLLVASTFSAWGRLETYVARRRCLAGMSFMSSARDPWRSYQLSAAEKSERTSAAALGSSR